MRVLDLDMDYFMDDIATFISESETKRLSEYDYGLSVWSEDRVRKFIECNLGLSKSHKIKGTIVSGHNEVLIWWKKLIYQKKLTVPFDVIHVDSHADLGLGYLSVNHILYELLSYPVEERPKHNKYLNTSGEISEEGIGDYLLFAIAYRWISNLVYCANPNGDKNDYNKYTLKDHKEKLIGNKIVKNSIQLVHNPKMKDSCDYMTKSYLEEGAIKEPEVPFYIIPTIEEVKFKGNFDYVIMAQSPNYTPASADFIIDIFKDYIEELNI